MNYATEYGHRCAQQSDIQDWLPTFYDQTCRYAGAQVLELGVRSGMSTAAFLAAVEQVDGHLWSVDIVPPNVPSWWHQPRWWTLHIGDDVSLAPELPDEVDVLFIDTSHMYEHTCAELRTFLPRVRAGGVVLMHDTELERPDGSDIVFPVAKALDEVCAERGLTWDNRPGCYGLGVIHIPV